MGTFTMEDQCGFQDLSTGDMDLWIHLAHSFAALVESTLQCSLPSGIVQISAISASSPWVPGNVL